MTVLDKFTSAKWGKGVVFLLVGLAALAHRVSAEEDNDIVNLNIDSLSGGGLDPELRQRQPSQQQQELLLLEALARRKPGQSSSHDVDNNIIELLGRSKVF